MVEEKKMVITIDGPSGSGKSTISKRIAAHLNYTYLDTGAMYRAVGLKARKEGIDLDSPGHEEQLARLLETIDLRLEPAGPGEDDVRVFVDDQDLSREIRTAEMGLVASRISAEPVVRKKLTAMQQQMGKNGGVVAEGRDTGTVVFPRAERKFYLDASPEERARRRWLQLREKGQEIDRQEILAQIKKRDSDDSSRSLAPLTPASDAKVVDCSTMSADEVVAFMIDAIEG